MTDYVDLALKYGGFTSLDKVYLENILLDLNEKQKMSFITPPPSVINAYFAELYQKKSPKAATSYFFELSKALNLFNSHPSFSEEIPFVRLNLSGKSFGYCYVDEKELACVFAEEEIEVTPQLLFEIAQVFPDYLIDETEGKIYMRPAPANEVVDKQTLTLLSDLEVLADGSRRLSSYSQDEIVELAQNYNGRLVYQSQNRTAMIYIV